MIKRLNTETDTKTFNCIAGNASPSPSPSPDIHKEHVNENRE